MSNGTATLPEREVRREERRMPEEEHIKEVAIGGTTISGVLAVAAGVLSIIGLANAFPGWMVTIATIVLGVSFLFEGGAIVARLSALLHEVTEGRIQMAELGAGTTSETLAGITGIVLGILGLLGVLPAVLIPSAAIVFGAALVIGAGANIRVNDMVMTYRHEHPMARQVAREAVLATTGLQVLTGLGAITLGIIALAGIVPLTLSLVAMLGIGAMFLLSNAAIAGRMLSVLQR
jgi:hypothetical protein